MAKSREFSIWRDERITKEERFKPGEEARHTHRQHKKECYHHHDENKKKWPCHTATPYPTPYLLVKGTRGQVEPRKSYPQPKLYGRICATLRGRIHIYNDILLNMSYLPYSGVWITF